MKTTTLWIHYGYRSFSIEERKQLKGIYLLHEFLFHAGSLVEFVYW